MATETTLQEKLDRAPFTVAHYREALMEWEVWRQEVLRELRALQQRTDSEEAHIRADQLLLEYIGDSEITAAFDAIRKWYS